MTPSNDTLSIRLETLADGEARERLLDAAFGDERFTKTCERLREGRLPADGLSFVAELGGVFVGTVRLWHVRAGGRDALMLGPLAVDETLRGAGIGGALMHVAIAAARAMGHGAILLVGDAPYYERFGFGTALTQGLWLPGAYESSRFLGLELIAGYLDGAKGLVVPTGELAPWPDLAALIAAQANGNEAARKRAA